MRPLSPADLFLVSAMTGAALLIEIGVFIVMDLI